MYIFLLLELSRALEQLEEIKKFPTVKIHKYALLNIQKCSVNKGKSYIFSSMRFLKMLLYKVKIFNFPFLIFCGLKWLSHYCVELLREYLQDSLRFFHKKRFQTVRLLDETSFFRILVYFLKVYKFWLQIVD